MTEIEKKVVEYAKSVNFDISEVKHRVQNFSDIVDPTEWCQLKGKNTTEKVEIIFKKYLKSKVRVLDQEYLRKPVPIELKFIPSVEGCSGYEEMSDASKKHSFWQNIVLISSCYENGWDLILVYNDSYQPNSSVKLKQLCLGKWNDGVIESEN